MTDPLPTVAVWSPLTGSQWGVVGDVPYTALDAQVIHNDVGPWSMSIPYGTKARAITPGSLLTVDWRGARVSTCAINRIEEYRDESTQALMLDVSGLDGLSYLAKTVAFPEPDLVNPGQQAYWDPDGPAPISGPAETVVLRVIRDNVTTRRALGLRVPTSSGRGATIRARPAFDSLLELVTKKASNGGIGVRLGLVDTTGSRADLAVSVYVPTDKSKQVFFSEDTGTLASWRRIRTAPTVTRAIVSGVEGKFRSVSTDASQTAGDLWGGRLEQFAQGPESFDNDELDEAGAEALDQGAATESYAIEPQEAGNLKAWRDYLPGDIGQVRLPIGATFKDVVTSARLQVDVDSGARVTTTFGDPDASDPESRRARLNRALRRDLSKTQRRS